jgi:hypothetical protein
MRMAIGLAGILVTIGVIVWIMSAITLPATKNALDVKRKVTPQVEQMAGHTSDGTNAMDTIQVAGQSPGGRLNALRVKSVSAGGAMDKHFGLKEGDVIIEIAPQGGALMPVKDMSSVEDAKVQLFTSYQNSQSIVVLRNGQKVTLPLAAAPKTPAAPAAGTSKDALQQQLDAIQPVPR